LSPSEKSWENKLITENSGEKNASPLLICFTES